MTLPWLESSAKKRQNKSFEIEINRILPAPEPCWKLWYERYSGFCLNLFERRITEED